MAENKGSGRVPDDFWDIDSLIPEKKNTQSDVKKRPSFDVSAVELEASLKSEGSSGAFTGESFTRFIPPHTAKEFENVQKPELEYKLDRSLIHSVKIFSTDTKYNFYERFLDDARKYKDARVEKCPPVPFFSYTPQYSQLNRAQLAYYLWWRENVRNGIYLYADYSYVLLYLYELINLSPETNKEYTLDMMCNIWLNYGKEHAFVAKYLGEWVCDFCLIHQLPVPSEKLRPMYSQIMKDCLIKEFYVAGSNGDGGVGRICADTLIEIASAYDYRGSRYATPERLPSMKKHLTGALDAVLGAEGEENCLLDGMRTLIADNSAVRTSYSGAICSAAVRKRLEIQYYSFTRSYELRYLVADILRYAENKLRKIWGIKSRLNIYALPNHVKKRIDSYFDSVAPTFRSVQKKYEDGTGEYEKLYDVPRAPLSLENADEIEEISWDTTKILVETFEEDVVETTDDPVSNETASEENISFADALGNRLELLFAILSGNVAEQRKIASALASPVEALVDEINEKAADALGDVLIDEGDDGYEIIEDYREMVEEMRAGR